MKENTKAETLLENYQSLSKCYTEMRAEKDKIQKKLDIALNFINSWKHAIAQDCDNPFIMMRTIQMAADKALEAMGEVAYANPPRLDRLFDILIKGI